MNEVLHSFAYSLDFLREQVADVSPADMAAQPIAGESVIANHPAWTLGHLIFACEMIGLAVGATAWLPDEWAHRYGSGSVPVSELEKYERKEELLAALRDAQARISGAVTQLTDTALNAEFPDPAYRDIFPTVRHALTQVLVGHTAFHIGQLSIWRKAMGLKPMMRSYE